MRLGTSHGLFFSTPFRISGPSVPIGAGNVSEVGFLDPAFGDGFLRTFGASVPLVGCCIFFGSSGPLGVGKVFVIGFLDPAFGDGCLRSAGSLGAAGVFFRPSGPSVPIGCGKVSELGFFEPAFEGGGLGPAGSLPPSGTFFWTADSSVAVPGACPAQTGAVNATESRGTMRRRNILRMAISPLSAADVNSLSPFLPLPNRSAYG